MKRKCFVILLLLLSLPVFSQKNELLGKPFLIIDCQRFNSVLSKACLYHLDYISSRIRFAGIAKQINSMTSLEYLTLRRNRYFFTRISPGKTGFWQKRWMLKRLRKLYIGLTNFRKRQQLIRIVPIENQEIISLNAKSNVVKGISAYLTRKRIRHTFFFEKSFKNKVIMHLPNNRKLIRVKFSSKETLYKKKNQKVLSKLVKDLLKQRHITRVFSILDFKVYLSVLLKKSQVVYNQWQSLLNYHLLLPLNLDSLLNLEKNEVLLYVTITKDRKGFWQKVNKRLKIASQNNISLVF